MKQGEIWNLHLIPVSGSEQGGKRPAIIISGNLLNRYLDVVIVCPLTTSIKNYKGNLILEPNKTNGLQKKIGNIDLSYPLGFKKQAGYKIGKPHAKRC